MKSFKQIAVLVVLISGFILALNTSYAASTASLSMSTTSTSSPYSVDLYVDPGVGNTVNAMQYSVQYDSTLLNPTSVTIASGWSIADSSKNASTSTLSSFPGYVPVSLYINPAISSKTKLATITFNTTALSASQAPTLNWISKYSSDGVFAADGNATNILNSSSSGLQSLTINTVTSTSNNTNNTTTTNMINTTTSIVSTTKSASTSLPNTGVVDNIMFYSIVAVGIIILAIFINHKNRTNIK